ncbi:mediator of RNA polymerase II transcription subunit 25-like isoform X12 [Ornithodoros turicata]|uniref:mediator of RNA polymerase II transcription subunit 25-like isoform X12 n=1 Tax=Ornithodoros turicata TaxID=34597 RepID=UPI003138C818
MVVAEQGNWVADVVFVVEGTANLSPYVESLKSNYIVPTLEYFNGGPVDDRDCGYDSNSTTYALVVFMAADCGMEPAATCNAPTTNVAKLLSWFDRVSFIGGAAESCSHIVEGLSTALQVFDDFQTLREPGVVAQKHCILICNSPPYRLPALESPVYSGHTVDQLAGIMAERQVNFSIFSPRKIPALYKLYEKAGGDLQMALCKNYAKDRRHLVLLKGYQLQERPISPPVVVPETKVVPSPPPVATTLNPRSPATTGVPQKRPAAGSPPNARETKMFKQPTSQASPMSVMGGSPQQPQGAVPFQSQGSRPGMPTPPTSHLASINQPNPPNVTLRAIPDTMNRTTQNQSPVPVGASPAAAAGGVRMPWNQTGPAVSTPPPATSMPLLASQLSNAPMASGPPMRPSLPTTVTYVSGSQMQAGFIPITTAGLRAPMRMGGQGGPQMGSGMAPQQSTLAAQLNQMPPNFAQVPNTQGANPQGMTPQGMNTQGMNPQGMNPQGINPQGMTPQGMNPQGMQGKPMQQQGPPQGPGPMQQQGVVQQQQQPQQQVISDVHMVPLIQSPKTTSKAPMPATGTRLQVKERRTIWQGQVEFQDKTPGTSRNVYTLHCSISSQVINGEPEVSADKWPPKLNLQLMPKSMLMNVVLAVKSAARCVVLGFRGGPDANNAADGLQKLSCFMTNAWLGMVHFASPPADIKLMLVLYMPEKNFYMGLIANDQESLFSAVKQVVDTHRKQQQTKNKMIVWECPTNRYCRTPMPGSIYQPYHYVELQNMSGGTMATSAGMGMPGPVSNPGLGMAQMMPQDQQQQQQQQQQQVAQMGVPPRAAISAPPQQMAGGGAAMGGAPPPSSVAQQQQANRLSQLEAERQQNLLKIQQLQQTLEAAQAKELQYKAAQEQQTLLERQRVVNHQVQAWQLQHCSDYGRDDITYSGVCCVSLYFNAMKHSSWASVEEVHGSHHVCTWIGLCFSAAYV